MASIKIIAASDEKRKELETLLNAEYPNDNIELRSDHVIYVAIEDGELRGGVVLDPICSDYVEMDYIIVHKDHRGKGIGSRLMEYVQGKVAEITLYAERWNHKSRKFYERFGFVASGEIPNAYPDGDGYAVSYVWNGRDSKSAVVTFSQEKY